MKNTNTNTTITPELNAESWKLVSLILNNTDRTLLYGVPGTGKTFAAYQTDRPVYTVTLTPETPAAELRGHYIPLEGKFVWQDGPALRAWREGARLVVNEINLASGDALAFLLNLLDDAGNARMTLPTGETVTPAPGFQCVATMNGQPDELSEALQTRFPVSLEILAPNPAAIASLPQELQNAALGSTLTNDTKLRINLRSWFAFAALRSRIGDTPAAAAVFGERAQEILDSLTVAAAK